MPGRGIEALRVLVALLIAAVACTAGGDQSDQVVKGIIVTSPAFRDSTPIPGRHSCDGEDLSPRLAWIDLPAGTRNLAVICDDPDAPGGRWVHWVLYNIPPDAPGLSEGLPASETLKDGSRQGLNDFGRIGYGGPCPPRRSTHRYFFRVYALDQGLVLGPRATGKTLERAMEGHVLGSGTLMVTFRRTDNADH
jgi:hypothetical protein